MLRATVSADLKGVHFQRNKSLPCLGQTESSVPRSVPDKRAMPPLLVEHASRSRHLLTLLRGPHSLGCWIRSHVWCPS